MNPSFPYRLHSPDPDNDVAPPALERTHRPEVGGRPAPDLDRRPPRHILAWVFWIVVAVNAALIIVLWVQGGNVSGVHTAGQLLDSLGRITGLLAAYLLLIQVLLIARLPWIERALGFDHLTVWHRLNGKVCLYLIVAHVVFITVGYALTDRITVPREISVLLSNYPGMITATIGTFLLILVVVSSLVIVRRRLRYEAWYFVHLTAYAGIVLTWFHEIPTGNEFLTNQPAARYWTALYLATLALLVVFRLVQPAFGAYRHRLRVAGVTAEGPDAVSIRIEGRHLDTLGARAGQFFLWRFFTKGRWWESHPFSLSAAPDGRTLRITVKHSGDFTNRLGELRAGTPVLAEGPFGVFTDAVRRCGRVALIAGGIGITPIRALLEEMPGDLVVVYRVLRSDDIIFREELAELAAQRGAVLHIVAGDHAVPENRHLLSPGHLRELIPDLDQRDVYICGPPLMMSAVEASARQAGVPSKFIHTERFAL
jgi:predicted ferric reductase